MMIKKIVTEYREGRFNYRGIYYILGEKMVDRDFYNRKEMRGQVVEEKEITVEEVEKMIDKYADFIDNWEQEQAAKAKNRRIEAFLTNA